MSKTLTRWLAASAALGLAAVAAQAQQPAKAPTSAKAPSAKAAAGMVVVRDAATGELRAPTADEAKALQPVRSADSQAVAAPAVERAMAGGYGLMLDESTHAYSVVTRQADGTLVESCVTGAEAANKIVAGSKRAAPVKFAKGVGHAELK